MADVRHRRKPTAANGLPSGLTADADSGSGKTAPDSEKPPSEPAPKKLQRIDCTKGHVGIACSNHLDPPGVLLDVCDPADLAHKAGLRSGDVVVRANGVSVTTHEALIDAVSTATAKDASDAARFLELEYLDAKAIAAAQAAALARRPPQKSLMVAYLLMFCAPPLGLHHLYLGRDAHCALHLASLGGFGLGWFRDLFCLPRYVSLCNEEPDSTGQIKLAMAIKPVPSRGLSRLLAMTLLGAWFAYVAGCLLPPFEEEEAGGGMLHPLVGVFAEGLFQAVGAAIAVYLVGTCPPIRGSFGGALRSAAASAAFVRFLLGWRYGLWPALGAMRGFAGSMSYEKPGSALQRRVRVSLKTRLLTLVTAVGVGYGCVGLGLYHHGGVTVASADGGFHTILFKDAVHHALQSPFIRNMPSLLYNLAFEGLFGGGFQEAWSNVFDSLDLAGEAHACEKLGLGKGCLEDWSTVKRAYRQLALEFHPDKQADATDDQRATAEARFREVQEAYEHLQKLHSSKKQEQEARSGQSEP